MINPIGGGLSVITRLMNPLLSGDAVQISPDITGHFQDPLGAGRFASATTPELMVARCYTDCDPGADFHPPPLATPSLADASSEPVQEWIAKTTGEGRAELQLGDGYTLNFDERSSEVEVFNANTSEYTRIWGDPHIGVDDVRAFDFWGTTTFKLENGAKITIKTEQWDGNPNAYVASKVVITKGRNAVVVDGISQNQLGDLSLEVSKRGYALDMQHRDGYLLQENARGVGWKSEFTGEIATQKDLDATRIGGRFEPGSRWASWAQTLPLFSQFMMFEGLVNFSAEIADDRRYAPERKPRVHC